MSRPLIHISAFALILLSSQSYGADKEPTPLKLAFKDCFLIGAALDHQLFTEPQQATLKLTTRHFNSVTPTNALKWGPYNPKPGVYQFEPADAFINFAQRNRMHVVGHVLFWHSQTPDWVFQGKSGKPATRDELLERMRDRTKQLATRYRNRIDAWDVVNESFVDNGKLRDSPWTRIIGNDFIEQAFRIADQELPKDVELLYNDYSMAGQAKRNAVVAMINDLKGKNIRIDGVGMQGHWGIDQPSINDIEASIIAFAGAGVKVHITELDIDILPRKPGMYGADVSKRLSADPSSNPYVNGLPEDKQQQLAKRYEDIFRIFLKHRDKIKRVTFWGATDRYSWLNNWPIHGRTSHPLLFDRNGNPKPAFHSVIKVASEK